MKANPLRISQETLNLDDIISDLNEEQPKAPKQKPLSVAGQSKKV